MIPAVTVRDELNDPSPEHKDKALEGRARRQASPTPEGARTWTADGTDGTNAPDGVKGRHVSLAAMPAGPRERRVAWAVVLVSALAFRCRGSVRAFAASEDCIFHPELRIGAGDQRSHHRLFAWERRHLLFHDRTRTAL